MSAASPDAIDRDFEEFCRTNDAQALARTYHALAPALRTRARARVKDEAAAEDLVQACFVVAIEARARFAPGGRVRPWLFGILEHRIDHLLRRRRRSEGEPGELATHDSPLERAERRELARLVHDGIATLPEPYRSVLSGVLVAGHGPEQLAAELGRPAPTVRSQLHRGLARLRRALPAVLAALARAASLLMKPRVAAATGIVAFAIVAVLVGFGIGSGAGAGAPLGNGEAGTVPGAALASAAGEGRTGPNAAATSAVAPSAPPARTPLVVANPPRLRHGVVKRAFDGRPLVDLELRLEIGGHEVGAGRVPVDGQGRFTLVDPPPGAMLRAPFARAALAVDAIDDAAELVLEVPPGWALTGRVLDRLGTPVAGATIEYEHAGLIGRVGTSDAQGRFLVHDLAPGLAATFAARHRALRSAAHRLGGTSGDTLHADFVLEPVADHDVARAKAPDGPTAEDGARVDFTLLVAPAAAARLEGFEALLIPPCGDEPFARARLTGGRARFVGVQRGPARFVGVPASPTADTLDPRVLTRRPSTTPTALHVDGAVQSVELPDAAIPSAWFELEDPEPRDARASPRRVVVLDRFGRPHGIFEPERSEAGAHDRGPTRTLPIGPLRPGRWILAVSEGAAPIRYLPQPELLADSRLRVPLDEARSPAVLRLLAASDHESAALRLRLCVGDALILLDSRSSALDPLRLAAGEYTLFWTHADRESGRLALSLHPGEQSIELRGQTSRTLHLDFVYPPDAQPADSRAALDLLVTDAGGTTLWRERALDVLDAAGRLRLVRAIPGEPAHVIADDRRGPRGELSLAPAAQSAVIELR